MACLQLPPSLRFKPENMFLMGVIPGPKEPSVHEMNHFLWPLTQKLLSSYTRGTWLSRTPHSPRGRLTRSALAMEVSDLPASRKTNGHKSYSGNTNFCHICPMDKRNINNIDWTSWGERDYQDILQAASAWKNAKSQSERKRIFDRDGVRWSVLMELPYWDTTRCVVIDGMHNLFLGLAQHHCRVVLGMDIAEDDGDTEETPELLAAVDRLQVILSSPTLKPSMLKKFGVPELKEFCKRFEIISTEDLRKKQTKKKELIVKLLVRLSIQFCCARLDTL